MTAALQSGHPDAPMQTGAECDGKCCEQVTTLAPGNSKGGVTATETVTDSAALRHAMFCEECMDRLDSNEPDHMHPTELAQGHAEATQGAVPKRDGVSCGGVMEEDPRLLTPHQQNQYRTNRRQNRSYPRGSNTTRASPRSGCSRACNGA